MNKNTLFYGVALIAASSFISCKSNEGGVAVSPFAPSQVRLEDSWCGLRGHFTGHYLSALSMLVGRYGDGWSLN